MHLTTSGEAGEASTSAIWITVFGACVFTWITTVNRIESVAGCWLGPCPCSQLLAGTSVCSAMGRRFPRRPSLCAVSDKVEMAPIMWPAAQPRLHLFGAAVWPTRLADCSKLQSHAQRRLT